VRLLPEAGQDSLGGGHYVDPVRVEVPLGAVYIRYEVLVFLAEIPVELLASKTQIHGHRFRGGAVDELALAIAQFPQQFLAGFVLHGQQQVKLAA